MFFLNLNWRKVALVIIAGLLPLLSINMEQKGRETDWIKQPFHLLSGLAQDFFFGFSHGIRSTTGHYVNLLNIKNLNVELKDSNDRLKTELMLLRELELENNRLRDLLQFKQKTKMEMVAARIVGRDLIPDYNTLTLNKGSDHGLKRGQAVITLKGALGTLLDVEPHRSHVMLITDRYSVVDGLVERTRAQGYVEGNGGTECSLKYTDRTTELTKGDLIVTGGLDNVFPKGFPLATVESVENKAYSVALKVQLKPVIEPNEVEEVFVVINSHGEDLTTPVPTATATTEPPRTN